MLLIENEENIPLHVNILEAICDDHTSKEVELLIIDVTCMS